MKIAPGLVLTLLLSLLTMTAHAGKIYKWTDADGNIHYGSAPPPEVEAKSTGQKTTTKKPEPPKETDAEGNEIDDDKPMSDKDRIRELEERLGRLEGKRQDKSEQAERKARGSDERRDSDALPGSDDTREDSAGREGEDGRYSEEGEEKLSEEDEKPDYSVQGQVRMLEKAERIERMKTRCRAKAPHGTDCNAPGSYKRY